jgi:hypothetical protein
MKDRNKHVVARYPLLSLLLGALAVHAVAGCGDEVRFGPPGGLRQPSGGNDACPIPDTTAVAACPDWATEVYPLFDDGGPFQCATAGCHGTPANSTGLYIPPGDAAGAYGALSAYKRDGRPYISTQDADHPYMLCNINPDPAILVGRIMPPSTALQIKGTDLATLGKWVECGMLQTGGVVGTGGGGAGGAGVGGN